MRTDRSILNTFPLSSDMHFIVKVDKSECEKFSPYNNLFFCIFFSSEFVFYVEYGLLRIYSDHFFFNFGKINL
jgi:hypothetical protein